MARLIPIGLSQLVSTNVSDTAATYSATAPYLKDAEVVYGTRVYVSVPATSTFTTPQSYVSAGEDYIRAPAGAVKVGDRVAVSSSTTLPTGLSSTTLYWVVDMAPYNTWYRKLRVSTVEGGDAVDITAQGSGTLTVYVNPNLGNQPDTSPDKWIDVRPVNKMAMFDNISITQTSNTSTIETQVTPGAPFNVVGFIEMEGASAVNIRVARDTGVSHTNYLTYSEQFNQSNWTKSSASVSTDVALSPYATVTGDKLTETGANAEHYAQQNATSNPAGSANVVVSIYAKAGERTWLALSTVNSTPATHTTYFDLANGAIGTTAAGHTASIESVGGGWYRCTVSGAQGGSTGTFTARFGTASADNVKSFTGVNNSGLYLWGAQIEVAAAVSAYVATTTAAVTTTVHAYHSKTFDLIETALSDDDDYSATYNDSTFKDRVAVSDIPPYATATAYITITSASGGTVRCGSCLFGLSKNIGAAVYGASVGIDNWTRIERDEWGGLTIDASRGYSDSAEYQALVPKNKAAPLRKLFADFKDIPALYLMAPNDDAPGGWDALGIHHAICSFRTRLDYPEHYLISLELEGVT